jgi:WhiB family redox-sensing transcriptional regulator
MGTGNNIVTTSKERYSKNEIDEELEQETQLWVFHLEEELGVGWEEVKAKRNSIYARNKSASEETYSVAFPPEEEMWRRQGACRGLDQSIFFPERGDTALPAYVICSQCPVRSECLKASLHEPFGVWAGYTYNERKKIRVAVDGGKTIEAAAAPWDEKRRGKLARARNRNSPALVVNGSRINPKDIASALGD